MEKVIEKIYLRKRNDLENKRFLFFEKNKKEINELFDIVERHKLKVDYSDFVIFCFNNSLKDGLRRR